MFAVIETGGRQFKVIKNVEVLVERLDVKEGSKIDIDKVLLVGGGASVEVGTPYVKSCKVSCTIVEHLRGEKLIAFKYKRRKSEKKKIGHRQELTRIRVDEIHLPKS